jgi:hypothetical protein
MDYQNHPYYTQPEPFNNPRRSRNMETASLVMGILALALFCCMYPPLICGSISIVLGLLSRGGEETLTSRAKAGITLGTIALGLFLVLLVFSVVYLSICFGGFSNMVHTMYDLYQQYGDDSMALYQAMMQYMQ